MGFGVDLQGKDSHEALLRIQDAEIRLLENIKRCIRIRIESDKKYSTALNQFVQQAIKVNPDPTREFASLCTVFKVWDTVVQETQGLVQLFASNAEEMSTKTMDKLNSLISEKKAARKVYAEERNRLENEFARLQDDVLKTEVEYGKVVDRLRLDKVKYEDLYRKGKPGGNFDDAKSKYLRTTMKLHQVHNDYVIGINDIIMHQNDYLSRTLPGLLDYHQSTQHILVEQCKDILLDYGRLTHLGLPQFQDIYTVVQNAAQVIYPDKEYNKFKKEHKSDALASLTFQFDENLMNGYYGRLSPNKLSFDDFTMENLQHRRAEIENQLNIQKKMVEDKRRELGVLLQQLEEVRNKLIQEECDLVKNDCFVKRRAVEIVRRHMTETECTVNKLQCLFDLIDGPLTKLSDGKPPPGLDLLQMDGSKSSPLQDCGSSLGTAGLTGLKSKLKIGFRKTSQSTNERLLQSKENLHLPKSIPVAASYEPTTQNTNDDFVPKDIADAEWFHGILPREEVQRLLQRDGDFLVCESKIGKNNDSQFVLSVFWSTAKHVIIQNCKGGWRFEGQIFPTVSELIHYQLMSGEPVTSKSQAILQSPVLKEEWELKNDDIELQQNIQTSWQGNFGEVYKGLFRPRNQIVAVKMCRNTLPENQKKMFLHEGCLLKQYDHPNIVRFIGIATQRQPVMIIMEFCTGGALLSFLCKQGKQQTKRVLVQMVRDAARGMAYLEEKGCIHRNLAARNCLIASNNVVKISDFGMSRVLEVDKVSEGRRQTHNKWTAPETLNYGTYTSLCDVWSFGILMWEVFSYGTPPYTGMSNTQARDKIEAGYRMPAPEGCPDGVHKLMLGCWEYQPDNRPHFCKIHRELEKILNTM